MAVGSAFYLGAALGAGPRDSLMLVLALRSGWRIGVVRTLLESSAVVVGSAAGRHGRDRDGRLRAADRPGAGGVDVAALPIRPRAPGSSITRGMKAKGLIAAGGEATRLGELTRVVNKHLLPVGGWPMVYYPLQLLQLAGVHEVMIVTGQGHAGQLIDLLGDGRMSARGATSRSSTSISPTRCRSRPAGSRRSSRWPRASPATTSSSSASATTSSSTPRRRRSRVRRGRRRRGRLRQGGPRPGALRRRRLRRGRTGRPTSSRRPASSTCATPRRRRTTRSSASTATRPTSSR